MNNQQKQLPFETTSITKTGSSASARGWKFDVEIGEGRPMVFFGLAILPDENPDNTQILDEIISRLEDTITYQKQLLEGNKVSVTNEDFFEQCLQKINSELSIFLRSISRPTSVKTWAISVSMVAPDKMPRRMQFFTSRFGNVTGWLLHSAQLDKKKLISIYDMPDQIEDSYFPQKFFRNVISTSLSANDQLFFCSPNLLNYISLSDIKKILSTLSIQSSIKHFENQVSFAGTDTVIGAFSLRLSPYPLASKADIAPLLKNAESSMDSLLNTQSETEKLLGPSLGLNFKSIKSQIKKMASSIASRSKQHKSKVIPNQSNPNSKLIDKSLQKVFDITASAKNVLAKSTKSNTGKNLFPTANKKIRFLSANNTITRVNILRKQISKALSPVLYWIQPMIRQAKQIGFTKMIKNPAVIGILLFVLVSVTTLVFFKKSHDEEVANIAQAQETIQTIKDNINRIDSHLIVGREGDATSLLQESLTSLASLQELPEISDDKAQLEVSLKERQQRLRKEIIIDEPNVLLSNLPDSLESSSKALAKSDARLFILGESPRKIISYNPSEGTSEIKTVSTDLNSYNTAMAIAPMELLLIGNKSVTPINFTSDAISASVNNQSNLIGATTYNDRFYTLAPAENQILRSNRAPNYSVLAPWIEQTGINISDARDLAIDGAIYVLQPAGIQKFLTGSLANPKLALETIIPPLVDAKFLWTSTQSTKLYILEQQRLILFDKQGSFIAQYTVPNKNFLDFAIDESRLVAYLLTAQELLEIKL